MSRHGIETEIQALARLNLAGLRNAWRERFGPPPPLRSPDLLRAALAWRLQAEALGGLDTETRRLLRRASSVRPDLPPPAAGTRVAREWKGERHEVEVLSDAIVYRGARYTSLSQVARVITGVRWNGPRFFGLRDAVTGQ